MKVGIFVLIILISLTSLTFTSCQTSNIKRENFLGVSSTTQNSPPQKLPGNPKGLPLEIVFVGQQRLAHLQERARSERWNRMSMGDATAAAGMALLNTPYKNWTLEIHDSIEAASVNLEALDCWTLFEIALGLAQLAKHNPRPWQPADLLREIEFLRYRGGRCDGTYLSRIHYLAEWWVEAERKGVARDITRQLGGIPFFKEINAMTSAPHVYPYLRKNPELIPPLRQIEQRVQALPVHHIPKDRVADIEPQLQTGDIIAITTHIRGEHCSHIGLAYRDRRGVLRFLHASKNHGRVVLDARLSDYLNIYTTHAGIMVARPLERGPTPL